MANDPPVLLLTGATGFIGRRLRADLSAGWAVVAASRAPEGLGAVQLDLGEPASVARVFDAVRPSVVVHCGAVADPDEAERDPGRARKLNVDATRALARLCGGARARLVFFSTDLVFDGEKGWYDEDDAPNPLSVYARTKLEAEAAVLGLCPGAVVLRVSSCYGRPLGGRTCFVDHMRASLAAGLPVSGFTDQWRTSTAADQLPEVVRRVLADPDMEGAFHWGGADRMTRYETAVAFCRALGFDESLVHPARAAEKRFLAPRPRDVSLVSARLSAAIGLAPRGLKEGFAALKGAW
jgi:dTDP-4-dehydrorhamnose reductase